jgi:adenosylhomocysteine nucleosidase
MNPSPILVCFAVKEEANGLGRPHKSDSWKTLLTGMGKKNATASIRQALAEFQPRLVISAGFAGGLNSELKFGTVVFDEDANAGLAERLLKAGAVPAKFHCADRVAVTAAEKRALHQSTGADAVEMESSVIRTLCREHKIPSATIRVISDAAGTDLPLDFNALMTPDYQIHYGRLALQLLWSPGKISQLISFQHATSLAAKNLGLVLLPLLRDGGA